jgi:alginate O-acetyltransferase complex protein AlgI
MMWAIAGAEFLALKLLTLAGIPWDVPTGRLASYVFLWPGMKPREFLGLVPAKHPDATAADLAKGLAKTALGLALFSWAVVNARTAAAMWVGWIGMLGIVFTLHFGGFDLLSWAWRKPGVAALPIMRSPMRSTSLSEFWGERWNLAFAEIARRFILRPLARPLGAALAGGAVFLISGIVHETVISVPARGGWGGPTLYFMLQAVGIASEKSATGRRIGLGRGLPGWSWVFLVAAVPIPLLFHPAFVVRVIVPMFQQFNAYLP